jgi:hypothetical protein
MVKMGIAPQRLAEVLPYRILTESVKQFVNMWKSAFFLALSKPGVIMDRKV